MSYMTDKQGVLDMVARGCRKLMAAGGGPLPQEQDWSARKRRPPTSPEDIARIVKLAKTGTMTARQIAQALGLDHRQVHHITYYREIRLPDERSTKQRNSAA